MTRQYFLSLPAVRSGLALLLCGIVLGAGVTYPWSCRRIHQLTQSLHQLSAERDTLLKQMKIYQDAQVGKVSSERISFNFRNKSPDYVKEAVERELRARLAQHTGKKLTQMDSLLLEQALDGQVFTVEQTKWKVQIRSIRITDKLEFSLELLKE